MWCPRTWSLDFSARNLWCLAVTGCNFKHNVARKRHQEWLDLVRLCAILGDRPAAVPRELIWSDLPNCKFDITVMIKDAKNPWQNRSTVFFLSSLLIFHVWYVYLHFAYGIAHVVSQIKRLLYTIHHWSGKAMQWMSRIQRWNLFAYFHDFAAMVNSAWGAHQGFFVRFSKWFTSAGSDLEQTIGSSCPVQASIQRQIDRFDHSILRFNSM